MKYRFSTSFFSQILSPCFLASYADDGTFKSKSYLFPASGVANAGSPCRPAE